MILERTELPAEAIVAELPDGGRRRNDGVVLRPANKNPWYVLATIFGEQEGLFGLLGVKAELAAKNRRAWNGWFCGGLSAEERAEQAEATGLDIDDLKPLSHGERAEILEQFKARMDGGAMPRELIGEDEFLWTDFSKTYFSEPVCFEQYVFLETVNFDSSVFSDSVSFRSALFSGQVSFCSVIFEFNADFNFATFRGVADFNTAKFTGPVGFTGAEFKKDSVFSLAAFSELASLNTATFSGLAGFVSTTFSGPADFRSAIFSSSTDFSSATFKAATRFTGAMFLTSVPQFHAAEVYDDTVFPTKDREQGNWPDVPIEGRKNSDKVMDAEDQKRAYNRLRLFMNRSLQIDEELFFHRMEMRCKHVLAKWPLSWLFGAYWLLSNYGSSVKRPAGWLVYLWLFGTSVKLQPIKGGDWPDWDTLYHAMGWSFANMAPLFGFRGAYLERADYINTEQIVVAGGQTIAGFILLFLLGLGLRSQFRLR